MQAKLATATSSRTELPPGPQELSFNALHIDEARRESIEINCRAIIPIFRFAREKSPSQSRLKLRRRALSVSSLALLSRSLRRR